MLGNRYSFGLGIILFCVWASSKAQIPDGIHLISLTEEAPEWTLKSPNYTHGFYPDDTLSVWLIRVDSGAVITFDFDVMEVAENDVLEIGNGIDASDIASVVRDNIITDFTGNLTGVGGARVTSNGNEAWMKFQSFHMSSCRGFSVKVRQDKLINENGFCKRDDFRCVNEVEGVTCLGNGSRCDRIAHCKDKSDQVNCSWQYNRFDESACRKCPDNQQYDIETQSCPVPPSRGRCYNPSVVCGCGVRGDDLGALCLWYLPYILVLPKLENTTHTLFLSGVNMNSLQNGTFQMYPNIKQLKVLVIQATTDTESDLKNGVFDGLDSLSSLVIFDINLGKIEANAFAGLGNLETLAILDMNSSSGLPEIEDGAFDVFKDKLSRLSFLYVNDYRLCCFFGPEIQESCREWFEIPELFVCSQLVSNYVLKVFMWFLGISAVLGNLFVMVWRWREKTENRSGVVINSFLVFNLAGADALMGLYMLIIAGADAHYGGRYFEVSDEWRTSAACKAAGFISILANEASVFLLVLISVARFMFIVFPFFSNRRLTPKVAQIVVGLFWLLTVILAVVSTVLASDEASDAYGLSDVCIGLPLTTRVAGLQMREEGVNVGGIGKVTYARPVPTSQSATWVFSIVLFLGVNLFCFCLILACYVAIFVKVKVSARRVRSRNANDKSEVRMAVKMAAIVMTDFLCWIPVILMGILFQAGAVQNNPEVFVWSVVFILPINSSLNPYLYTFLDICLKKQRNKSSKKKEEIQVETTPSSQKTTSTTDG